MHKICKTRDAVCKLEICYMPKICGDLKLLQVKQGKRILGTEAFIKVIKNDRKLRPLESRGRVDWIRTSDPLTPSQVRYQTAPPPEIYKTTFCAYL